MNNINIVDVWTCIFRIGNFYWFFSLYFKLFYVFLFCEMKRGQGIGQRFSSLDLTRRSFVRFVLIKTISFVFEHLDVLKKVLNGLIILVVLLAFSNGRIQDSRMLKRVMEMSCAFFGFFLCGLKIACK